MIINFHFYNILYLKTMVWSHVSILWHFIMISRDYNRIPWVLKFCGLSMIFYYWKSLFKIHFGHKNFICWPIFKISAGLVRTNRDLDADKKIFFLPSKRQKFSPKIQYLRNHINLRIAIQNCTYGKSTCKHERKEFHNRNHKVWRRLHFKPLMMSDKSLGSSGTESMIVTLSRR